MYFLFFLILLFILLFFSSSRCNCRHCKKETFKVKRKRRKGKPVKIGLLNNTPAPIKKLMKMLNKLGGQLVADKQYDTVATDYLDKKNIK